MPLKTPDLSGHTFGILRADILSDTRSRCGDRLWSCVCACGRTILARGADLRLGKYQSCGCAKAGLIGNALRTHGLTHTAEFEAWSDMIGRCHRSTHKRFGYYGARGITVCPEWRGSFESFLGHIGSRPGPGFTLDRVDTNGNYEPGNIRWTTWKVQNRNRRNTKMVTALGRTAPLGAWVEDRGLDYNKVKWRLRKGWTPERALDIHPNGHP